MRIIDLDRVWSKLTGAQVSIGGIEVHRRGGKQIGVRRPNGFVQIGPSRDIVINDVDGNGKHVERYRFNRPPKGFTVITQEDLNEELQNLSHEISMAGGME